MVYKETTPSHFATLDTVYDQQTTVHHWQLKDLVACESSRILYCVNDRNTIRYDTEKKRVHNGFLSIHHKLGHGYIAAGGQNSRMDIRLLNNNEDVYNGTIGNTVNNSIRITEASIGLVLFVCNNDKTVKMFSLPDMDAITTLQFTEPVNYSAPTTDVDYIACVGDSVFTHIYQTSESGFRKMTQLKGFTDVGMCCAWDPLGIRLAAASQDGSVCVWDRRSFKVISTFKANSACRNVKFSSPPMDLMAFTEDSGTCHLVDARNLNSRQILTLDEDNDHSISGLCFSPDGKTMFVGTASNGIYSFGVDTVGRRRLSEGSFL